MSWVSFLYVIMWPRQLFFLFNLESRIARLTKSGDSRHPIVFWPNENLVLFSPFSVLFGDTCKQFRLFDNAIYHHYGHFTRGLRILHRLHFFPNVIVCIFYTPQPFQLLLWLALLVWYRPFFFFFFFNFAVALFEI